MTEYFLTVSSMDEGKRLDVFISEYFIRNKLGLSRMAVKSLITGDNVRINNVVQRKPHYSVKASDEIHVVVQEKKSSVIEAEDIPLEIIYNDDDIAVINKPVGLVVHPAPGNYTHTLVNALIFHFKELSTVNPQRPGIVHRLDKDTSGVMVVARNNHAHLGLVKQFADHSIKRVYFAAVKGRVEFCEHIIELPIGRHPYKWESMVAGFGRNTRYAKTYYRVIKRTEEFSFLELVPFTGRTHQLRVHLSSLGHPILGDTKYGKNNEFFRLALHAKTLGFIHPRSAKYMEFSSDLPQEFERFTKRN